MNFKRILQCTVLAIATFGAAGPAVAGGLPFCVSNTFSPAAGMLNNMTSCNGVGANAAQTGFSADLLNGTYNEKILVSAAPTGLTFNATILANWGTFVFNGANIADTGLGAQFQLYAVVQASGIITGANSFTATSATFSLFFNNLSPATSLTLADIGNTLTGGVLAFTGDTGPADRLIGTSSFLVSGSGTTSASAGTDGFAVTFGAFNLTEFGESFFIAPRPFYLSVYSDGDINDGSVETVAPGLLRIQGDLSAEFRAVPEPGSLALAGLALLGVAAARRRKA